MCHYMVTEMCVKCVLHRWHIILPIKHFSYSDVFFRHNNMTSHEIPVSSVSLVFFRRNFFCRLATLDNFFLQNV